MGTARFLASTHLSLSGFYVVSQFETGQDLHGVQADVDPVGWRREPSG